MEKASFPKVVNPWCLSCLWQRRPGPFLGTVARNELQIQQRKSWLTNIYIDKEVQWQVQRKHGSQKENYLFHKKNLHMNKCEHIMWEVDFREKPPKKTKKINATCYLGPHRRVYVTSTSSLWVHQHGMKTETVRKPQWPQNMSHIDCIFF